MTHRRTGNLLRNTKTKVINISSSLIIVASSLSGALPVFLSQKAFAAGTAVTPDNYKAQGWEEYAGTGNISFVADSNAPSGAGALQLDTPTSDAETQLYRDIAPTPVDSVHDLGYSVKRLAGDAHASPSYVLGIDTNSDGNDDFYAWYEPVYNGGANYDQWQNYIINPATSKFWTAHAVGGKLAGGNGSNFFTLNDVAQDFPGAKVIDLTINQGSGNAGWSTRVDNVAFNGTTYNFEPDAPSAPTNLRFVRGSTPVAAGSSVNYTNVTLQWDTVQNASRYQVQVTDPNGDSQSNRNTGWYTFDLNDPTRYGFFSTLQGTWTYQVRTEDATTGLWSAWSNSVSLTYDHTPPAVSFADPTPANNAFVNNTFHVKVVATDNLANDFVAVDVRTKDNPDSGSNPNNWRANCTNGVVSGTGVTETYECDVNTSGLNDGETYTLRASVKDKAGNWGQAAYQLFTVNRDAPVAPTNLQAKFQYDSGNVASGTYLNIAAKPGNNNLELLWDQKSGDWVDHYLIHITYPDGSTNTGWQGPNTNAWLIPNGFGQHGDGKYTFEVEAVNPNGSSTSKSFVLYYDAQKPTVTIHKPAAVTTSPFTISVTADDDVALGRVVANLHDANGVAKSCTTSAATPLGATSYTLTCGSGNLAEGTYTLKTNATDEAGNTSATASQQIVVDNTAPTVSLNTPAANSAISGKKVRVRATASDANFASCVLNIYNAGKVTNAVYTHTCPQTDSFKTETVDTLDSTALKDGSYDFVLTATDQAGNATSSTKSHVTVDNTAPSTPAADPDPTAGSYESTQLITLSSSDANGTPTIYYTLDASTPSKTNGTQYTSAGFTLSSDATVKAIAYDAAGNASGVLTANYTITDPNAGGSGSSGSNSGGQNDQSQNINNSPITNSPQISLVNYSTQFAITGTANGSGAQSGSASNTNSTSAVLGATTQQPSDNGNGVKGDSTVQVENASDKKNGNFLGLGWWWLAVLAVLILAIYGLLRRAGTDKKSA